MTASAQVKSGRRMQWILRRYPFNAEQTVNLLSEFGPLVTLFVINAAFGVTAGIWSLIVTTLISLVVMWLSLIHI